MDSASRKHVLIVDDDEQMLASMSRSLGRVFEIVTASSAPAALEILCSDREIAVVISDMAMPGMNGAEFLRHAREIAPRTIRMLLTGQQDLESAIAAVNSGQIFRFLTKPSTRDELRVAIQAALEQHVLQTAERELLDQTLRGSIAAFVDVLGLTNPAAFGCANRLKTRVLELAHAMGLEETWQLEIAALACQLGYISLPHELCIKLERKQTLTDDERKLVADAPAAAARLLAHIPRLEVVLDIIALQSRPPPIGPHASGNNRLIQLGANILRFARDYDELTSRAPALADDIMRSRGDRYAPAVVEAYARLQHAKTNRAQREITLAALRVGMTLADDVRFTSGALIVTSGYVVTPSFIERVRNYPPGSIAQPLHIFS